MFMWFIYIPRYWPVIILLLALFSFSVVRSSEPSTTSVSLSAIFLFFLILIRRLYYQNIHLVVRHCSAFVIFLFIDCIVGNIYIFGYHYSGIVTFLLIGCVIVDIIRIFVYHMFCPSFSDCRKHSARCLS